MIIQFHTPAGKINVDTETATDTELVALHMTREALSGLVPRDLPAEIDGLKTRVLKLEAR